ncbi:helix-turn-helix domain-containing protein [Marinospirillum sp.]|uniref:helix-turn-helix domain-containing protein n=1 Tax=Marinospirillum sp. TaxID=2183934 RepID=UPI003A847E40
MLKLGERIQHLRKSRHMTQQQLADQLGIDQGAISRWERNHITPSARYRQALERTFQASLMDGNHALFESVNRDLHDAMIMDCDFNLLAASETAIAIQGCRTRQELLSHPYLPLSHPHYQALRHWLKDANAFSEGVNWVKISHLPCLTVHSGVRWMDCLLMPFRLDSGELVYRISQRLQEPAAQETLVRALLEREGQQRELLLPIESLGFQLNAHKAPAQQAVG